MPGACGARVVGATARRPRPLAGRRQLRILHRDLRLAWRRPGGGARALILGPAGLPARAAAARCAAGGGAGGRGRGGGASRWRRFGRPRGGTGVGAERIAGAGAREGSRAASPAREASRARWAASDSTLRTASSSDSRSRVISDSLKRRLDAAQLRDQRGARPLIERTAALAGSTGIQSGDGAGNQRVVISHFYSTMQAFR